MASLLEIAGANRYEIMAYQNGAENVWEYPGELTEAVEKGDLTDVSGIGKGLARVITELVKTGKSTDHEELVARFPAGLPDVLMVPGLGPKKVKALYEQLEVGSLEDLIQAVADERVRTLRGFGAKTEETILGGIGKARERIARRRGEA